LAECGDWRYAGNGVKAEAVGCRARRARAGAEGPLSGKNTLKRRSMLKLFRFIGLVSQSIFLQFVHLVGFAALAVGVALGWFRMPSWLVPIVAVVIGVLADYYFDLADVTGILEKAGTANQRGGFVIVVYFVIVAVGYVVGAYGRSYRKK
jgi:hypothetical protein